MNTVIDIHLTDDQTLFLESLRHYLENVPDIRVIGHSTNGIDTIEAMNTSRPDVLLLDLRLPDISGLDVAIRLRERFPDIGIIILTSFESEGDLLDVAAAGVDAYIAKDIPPNALILVIKTVAAGFTVLHKSSYMAMCHAVRNGKPMTDSRFREPNFSTLTVQESRILRYVVEGRSNKEIASLLEYTEGTVKNYLSRILQKTGCRDRTSLAVEALKAHIL